MALFSISIHEKMGNRQHKSRVLKLFSIFPYWIFFYVITHLDLIQKQPPEVFCKKRCSQKFHKIHKKTPVPESLFNKVAGLRPATLLKKRLWHRYFKVQPYSYERKTLELWPRKKNVVLQCYVSCIPACNVQVSACNVLMLGLYQMLTFGSSFRMAFNTQICRQFYFYVPFPFTFPSKFSFVGMLTVMQITFPCIS